MEWCYKHYIERTKPKGIFKKIIYKIWLMCGVSPSGIIDYLNEEKPLYIFREEPKKRKK